MHDFGTDAGMCQWVTLAVHDEKEFSKDWGHWFKEGSYPGLDNGIRMLLDAESFDSGPGEATAEVPRNCFSFD